MANAEVTKLVRAVEQRNDLTAVIDNGHIKFQNDNGETFVHPKTHKVISLPGTPSDHRWRGNAISALTSAGLLDGDPKKAGRKPTITERTPTPAEEEKRRLAVRDSNRRRAEENKKATELLHTRASRVLTSAGVWKKPKMGAGGWKGSVREAGKVLWWWCHQEDRVFPKLWASEEACLNTAGLLYNADSIAEWCRTIWYSFLDDLDEAPVVQSRYQSYYLAMQKVNVIELEAPSANGTEPPSEGDAEEEEPGVVLSVAKGYTESQLRYGLRVMSYMQPLTEDEREAIIDMVFQQARRWR